MTQLASGDVLLGLALVGSISANAYLFVTRTSAEAPPVRAHANRASSHEPAREQPSPSQELSSTAPLPVPQ